MRDTRKTVVRAATLLALLLVAGSLLLWPATVPAQVPESRMIAFEPAAPVQGTLFRILINAPADTVSAASGSAAGEVLHFTRGKDGRLSALAAAPLDGGGKLELNITLARTDGSSTPVRLEVPVSSGSYVLDKLTVAPQFGAPPSKALQARIDRERERALAVSRRAHETARLWDSVVKPRDTRITSGYGNGREFNGTVQSRHTGTDFAGAVGEPVRAAARGVVALVDTFYLAGRVIYIDHGEGLVTAYFHLSAAQVSAGDSVEAGQVIGKVGATGRVTGPHLHWVVRFGAISVDPMSLLALGEKSTSQ